MCNVSHDAGGNADACRDVGIVDVHYDLIERSGQLVSFETHFKFAEDDIEMASTTLRCMSGEEVAGFLGNAGFTDITWYGDWNGSPPTATSAEIIAHAR